MGIINSVIGLKADIRPSRRTLLCAHGIVALGAALPNLSAFGRASAQYVNNDLPAAGESTAADRPIGQIMQYVSNYISQAHDKALPADVIEQTKWHVLDTFAAIVAGSQLPAGKAALHFAHSNGGRPLSTVVTDPGLIDPINAAMVNAVMADADETDDTGVGPWHAGTNTLPAALALGEELGINGSHFLRSIALGYDIGTRILWATGAQMNFKNPTLSMAGYFGATAAAACVAKLNSEQTRWALSYAAQQCSGIDSFRRDPDHIEKAFTNAGMGARGGVTSALLVTSGFTAVNDIFSGQASFFETYSSTARPERLIETLGQRYLVKEASFKRWPVGAPVQLVADALEALIRRETIDPAQIREIVLRQIPNIITDNAGPLELNVQHVAALMLIDKKLNFRNLHDPERAKDPAIFRLRSLTRLVAGSPLDPNVAVQITFASGSRITQEIVPNPRGTSLNPYTQDWVVEKAQTLMTPVIGKTATAELVERTLRLESLSNLRELRPLLQSGVKAGPPRLSEWPSRGSS